MLIDTHAHLYYDQFTPDFDQVIKHAKDNNIKAIINIGADLESSKKSVRLENDQIKFYSSIGVHPHEAKDPKSNQMSSDRGTNVQLEQIYVSYPGKVVAVGECGLDYYFQGINYSPSNISQEQQKVLQKQLFQDQIALAKKLNLPLIIHCRDSASTHSAEAQGRTEQSRSAASSAPSAWDDIFLPELIGTTGVFHSFTATEIEAKKALDLGYYLGLSCIVTYPKNDHLRQIIKWAPLERILTETDCPFLPPQTQRGQRNEPANITEVVKVIAEIKGFSEKNISQATWENACRLFNLPTNPAS